MSRQTKTRDNLFLGESFRKARTTLLQEILGPPLFVCPPVWTLRPQLPSLDWCKSPIQTPRPLPRVSTFSYKATTGSPFNLHFPCLLTAFQLGRRGCNSLFIYPSPQKRIFSLWLLPDLHIVTRSCTPPSLCYFLCKFVPMRRQWDAET